MTTPEHEVDAGAQWLLDTDAIAAFLDHGPVGLLVWGGDDIIRHANTTVLEWLGRSAVELIDTATFQELLAPGDRIYHDTHLRPLLDLQGHAHEIAVELVRGDGSRLPALVSCEVHHPPCGEALTGAVIVDATRRRQYEQELLLERRHAEHAQTRLQVMHDVVAGLAGATTVEEVVSVVAERGERSIEGARCGIWLFAADEGRAVRVDGNIATHSHIREMTFARDAPAFAILAAGELIVIADTQESGDYPLILSRLRDAGIGAAVISPIFSDGELHGIITYGFEKAHLFDEQEIQAARSMATQAEDALARARAHEAERRGRERLSNLFRFAADLSQAATLDDVIDVIERDSRAVIGAELVRIALLERGGEQVRFSGRTETDPPVLSITSASMEGAAIRGRRPVETSDRTDAETRYPDSPRPAVGVERMVALPLADDADRPIGVWVVGFADVGAPADEDLQLMRLFAELASQAAVRAGYHADRQRAQQRAEVRLLLSGSLNEAMTTAEVAEAVTTQAQRAFGADGLAVFLGDAGRPQSWQLMASAGLDPLTEQRCTDLLARDGLVAKVATSRAPRFLADEAARRVFGDDAANAAVWASIGILPVVVGGATRGALMVGFGSAEPLTDALRVALAGLAAEAGAAVGRAERYEVEHEVAVTLQQSLIQTSLPNVPGWSLSSCHVPGTTDLLVGGDFFDVTAVDGRLRVAVGDVVGHGLSAAAAMGQLRSATRALSSVLPGPVAVLRGLDDFAARTAGVRYSTVCCVEIDADGRGRYACAGHPYPILRRANGVTELLREGRSPLLGLNTGFESQGDFTMGAHDTLILYTDGLVESRDATLDEGMESLRSYVSSQVDGLDATTVVRDTGDDGRFDDVLVLCIARLPAS